MGEAADGAEAVALAGRVRPDIVLMDISMPRMDGLAAARGVLDAPHPPKVIIKILGGNPRLQGKQSPGRRFTVRRTAVSNNCAMLD
ncbi:response regulator [Microbispora sp. NBC_01389]|uniref:response regulator n=1 Tax=Microbispora sp. NBC_01389 TaxID=2903584 RepID=UPI0038695300